MPYMYILYSSEIERFYIGATSSSPDERLVKHLTNHSGFTARAKDWKVVYYEKCPSIQMAKARERELKDWKSKYRIQKLIDGSEHPA